MLAPDFQLTQVYADQYRDACYADDEQEFYYVSAASDYPVDAQTDRILEQLFGETNEALTVLDAGSGDNTFLKSKIEQYGSDKINAIGISAVSQVDTGEVTHVQGDLQRLDTWQPAGILLPNSVDLAVTNLALRHLVDPLRGLVNILGSIKPNGHFVTDYIPLKLDPSNRDNTLETLLNGLLKLEKGQYSHVSWIEHGNYVEIGGTFSPDTEEVLRGIRAVPQGKYPEVAMYTTC